MRTLLSTAAAALFFAASAQPAQSPPTLTSLAAQNKVLTLQVAQLQTQVRDIQYTLSQICLRGKLMADISQVTKTINYVRCS